MTRRAVRSILLPVAALFALAVWPAEAYAQRYAYLVRDCISACVGQQLLIFDAATGSAVTQVQLAVDGNGQPTAVAGTKHLAISPEGRRAYVTFDQRIVVVNLETNTVLGQFSGVQAPSYPVLSSDGQRLYVLDQPNANSYAVVVLNTATGTATTYPMTGISGASDLSVTADESTAVVRTSTGLAAMAFGTGAVRSLAMGTLTDVILHPDGQRAFTLT